MTISEASKELGIPVDTIRYYEKVGLIPNVKKTAGGIRDFDEADIRMLNFVKCMRTIGISIEKLKIYVDLFLEGDSTISVRKEILLEEKAKLLDKIKETQGMVDFLDNKINGYDKKMLEIERQIKTAFKER